MKPARIFRDAVGVLWNQPQIIMASTAYILASLLLVSFASHVLSPTACFVLAGLGLPFTLGGLYEMLGATRTSQDPSFTDFWTGGQTHYLTIVLAYGTALAILMGYLILFSVVGQGVIIVDNRFIAITFIFLSMVGVSLLLIPLQFLDIMLVTDHPSLRAGIQSTATLLWEASSELLVYTAIRAVMPTVTLLGTFPLLVLSRWSPTANLQVGFRILFALSAILAYGILLSLLSAFHTEYYHHLADQYSLPQTPLGEDTASTDNAE